MAKNFWTFGEDGRRVAIFIYPQYANATTRDSRAREIIETGGVYKTDEGLTVNKLEKGKYQIVETGEILRSDDPSAP